MPLKKGINMPLTKAYFWQRHKYAFEKGQKMPLPKACTDLGSRVRVTGLGFKLWGLGCRVRTTGLGFRIQGLVCRPANEKQSRPQICVCPLPFVF